jgi:putative tricarboxylic transport membrane protein
MKESNMPRADFIASMILIVVGVATVWNSLEMPRYEDQGGSFLDSPGIVPAILGVLLVALSLVVFIRSIVKGGYKLGWNRESLTAVLKDTKTVRMLVTIAFGVVYGLVLMRYLHFIASTLIFVFVFIVVFEYDVRKSLAAQWKVPVFASVISVVTTIAVYFAFQRLFLVNLP